MLALPSSNYGDCMTPTDARAVAKFLGNKYTHSGGGFWVLADDDAKPPMSDAALLLALLERAAGLKLLPNIDWNGDEWNAWMLFEPSKSLCGKGHTPLSALIAAVVAYGDKHD